MKAFYDSPEWTAFSPGHPGGEAATGKLTEKAGLPPGARVLDLCCGGGDSVRLLNDLGFHCTGADRESVVSKTRQKYPQYCFYSWEGGALPFEDGAFDAVLCECSLSQLDNTEDTLREVRRILVREGFFLVSDVYEGSEPEIFTGFERLWWEDGTKELRAFAARWIWETGKAFPCAGSGSTGYYYAIFKKSGGGNYGL